MKIRIWASLIVWAGFCQGTLAQYFLIPDGPGHGKTWTRFNTSDAQAISFEIPTTNMSLLYPADFHKEDPGNVEHHNYRAVYGDPAKRETCFPPIFEVGAGDPLIRLQDEDAKHFTQDPPTGGIVVQEIMPNCLVSENPKATDEDKMIGLVAGPSEMSGFHSLASELSYTLDGHFMTLGTAMAFSKDADGVRRASVGMTMMASVCMSYRGRLFLFTMTANNPGILNQLLRVRVQFGKEEPWPLVPFSIQPDDHKGNKKAVPLH